MQYKNFGRTGVEVSELCLGCGNFGGRSNEDESFQIITRGIDAGINFLDTADRYNEGKSEEIVGKTLRKLGTRDKVILATKFCKWSVNRERNQWGLSRRYIIQACEASLKRLQTDYIDLYQIHRPFWDVALDETLRALDDLIRAGKIRYAGTSNYAAWELMESLWASKELGTHRFVSEQPAYNLLNRRIERELIPFAQTYSMAVMVWAPLARGFFSGRYERGQKPPEGAQIQEEGIWSDHLTDRAFDVLEVVQQIAKEKGCTPSQFALAWVMKQKGITCPIIGPRTVAHLEDNLTAINVTIAESDQKRIDEVSYPGQSVVRVYGFHTQPHAHRW